MRLTQDALISICRGARTLDEHLDASEGPAETVLRDEDLVRWREVVARGDSVRFGRRLAWLERDRLSAAPLLPGMPSWAETLAALLETEPPAESRWRQSCEPLAFEEALGAFVQRAAERVSAEAGRTYDGLEPQAHASMERTLAERLALMCERVLFREFSLRRASSDASALESSRGADYPRFVAWLGSGGWTEVFGEYCVLARLVATTVDRWVEASVRFLAALETDRPELSAWFASPTESVVRMTRLTGLWAASPWGAGSVTFQSGRSVVYKSRSLELDAAFARLVQWNKASPIPDPRAPWILERTDHGWMEVIEQRPCQTARQVRDYYHRVGGLLCLVYVLGGTDMHCDNLIASGEHPMLIDLETLMQPGLPSSKPRNVLETGFLPLEPGGQTFNRSALRPSDPLPRRTWPLAWVDINTDRMRPVRAPGRVDAPRSSPSLQGQKAPVEMHSRDLLDGFRHEYELCMRRKPELLARTLREFRGRRSRFLMRSTRAYLALLSNALEPERLRDGVSRSIELDVLSRPLLEAETPPAWWPLVQLERRALERSEIPEIMASVDDATVVLDGTPVRCLARPSLEEAVNRIESLGPDDLARQLEFIRLAVHGSINFQSPTT